MVHRNGLLTRVIVEAAARLATEMAGCDELAKRRRWGEPLLPVFVEHDLSNRVARVEADEIEQLERTHRVVRAALHRRVDLLDRPEALLERADRVVKERDQ